jgi:hypothetical protein
MNIALTPEHAAFIAKYAALTGYTPEELTNWFLADCFQGLANGGFEEAIGSMSFKDKESAERVQAWMIQLVGERHHLNSIQTEIISNLDGTFEVSMTVPDRAWPDGPRYRIA